MNKLRHYPWAKMVSPGSMQDWKETISHMGSAEGAALLCNLWNKLKHFSWANLFLVYIARGVVNGSHKME